jgi:hypothetical protein
MLYVKSHNSYRLVQYKTWDGLINHPIDIIRIAILDTKLEKKDKKNRCNYYLTR